MAGNADAYIDARRSATRARARTLDSGVAKKFVLNPHGLIDNASRI